MLFTTEQLQEIYAYVMAQMQTSQINELPAWSDYGELLLTDRLAGYKMNEGVTVWIPISAVLELGAAGAGNALSAPALTLTVVSDSHINATWLPVAGATDYKLYRAATPDFIDAVELLNAPGLSFEDSGRTPSSTYFYWLQATGSGFGDSPYATANATTTGATIDTTPPVLASAVIGAGQPYKVVLTYNEPLTEVANGDTSKFAVTGARTIQSVVVSGTTVTVSVAEPFTGGETVYISYSGNYVKDVAGNLAPTFTNPPQGCTNNLAITIQQLAAPSITARGTTSTTVDVDWTAVANANGYDLQRSEDGISWTTLGAFAPTTLHFGDTGLTASTTEIYRVRAIGAGNFTTSNWATASVVVPASGGGSFNTMLTFSGRTHDSAAGVGGSVQQASGITRFRFNALTNGIGTNSMTIYLHGTLFMIVDFPTNYLGAPFSLIDNTGVGYSDIFTNGAIDLP